VRVTGVELRRLRLPLLTPFRTAAGGNLTERDLVVVRAVHTDGEGWGECAAMPFAGYDGEDTDEAWRALRDELVPALLATGEVAPSAHRSAAAALRTALLDACLRAEGRSLAAALGATRARVPAGAAVGLHESVDALLRKWAAWPRPATGG
jgi:O-succinylbenzoate synthase